MKVLVVYSYNNNRMAPFIAEQIESLRRLNVHIETFGVVGKGIKGYLSNRKLLIKHLNRFEPDIIHAHYGLMGLLANLQRKVPVVTTYHGSDINKPKVRSFSKMAIQMSAYNIFVSQKLVDIAKPHKHNFQVIPCGIDTEIFYPKDKIESRKILNLDLEKRYILFSKAFFVKVKNYPLAKSVADNLDNAELIELHGYNRDEVSLLMNACDVALMTSFSEGSPQFIKEAMACNCPIVSTDVGDVRSVIEGIDNCYICSYDPDDVIEKVKRCFIIKNRNEKARERIIRNYSLDYIAEKIIKIYKVV